MTKSNYWRSKIADLTTGKLASYAHPTSGSVWIALHTGAAMTSSSTAPTEPSALTGYGRKQTFAADWKAAANGRAFGNLVGLFTTIQPISDITGFCLMDAAVAGNVIDYQAWPGGTVYNIPTAHDVSFQDSALLVAES